jgi:hypothetical protein
MKSMVNWERWAPASGILFVALLVIGTIVAGSPASYDDSGSSIATWLADNRRDLLIATILQGGALLMFLWYLGSLGTRLREAGEARLGAVAFGAGVVIAGMAAVTITIVGGLAYGIEQNTDSAMIKTLYDLQLAAGPLFAWPLAALAGATALASLRTGIFPQWYGLASAAGTVWFVLTGFTWARDGFFAVDGAAGWIGYIAFLAWTLVTSVVLLQQAQAREEAPRAAMASM